MENRIDELRRKIEALASTARALKCEAEDADHPAFTFLENVEDALDLAATKAMSAASAA